jgi:hypothetical protein
MRPALARKARAAALTLMGSLTVATALACGYCVEDRIAAVYDHALVQRIAGSQHQLAYFAWDGPSERGEAARLKMLALGEATAGVDKGSVRVSMDPAAIAVAFDPRRTSAAAVGAALGKKLESLKLAVIPLQAPVAAPAASVAARR